MKNAIAVRRAKGIAQKTILLFTCSVLLIGCSKSGSKNNPTPTSETANTIPIGIAFAQTSNVALLGQEGTDGVKIAEKYFNDKGGINGKQIKLIFQDTGGDEVGAVNAFQTLINQNKVVLQPPLEANS